MAEDWKPVSNATIALKNLTEPKIGTYIGQSGFEAKGKQFKLWNFKDESGKPYSFYQGTAHLDMQMKDVLPGQQCRITYQGKHPRKNKAGIEVPTHQVLVETREAPMLEEPQF